MIKNFLTTAATRYRLWMCACFGHNPNRDTVESRELVPDWPYPTNNIAATVDWNREHHYESYTTCTRCGVEVTYVRFFNFWCTKAHLVERNLRKWLNREDATKVRDTF